MKRKRKKKRKSTKSHALFNVMNSSKLNAANATSKPFCEKPPLASKNRRRHPIAYSSIIALQLQDYLCAAAAAAAASPLPLLPPLSLIAKPNIPPPQPPPPSKNQNHHCFEH
jgi:hypothetical protein